MAQYCRVCSSPYRREIDEALKAGIIRRKIYDRYAPLLHYEYSEHSWGVMLSRHKNHKPYDGAILVPTPIGSAIQVKRVTLETYTKKMLELGIDKANETTPDKVKFQDVNNAIKLSLDAQKIKIAENALELQMAKMFGPTIQGEEVEEGEVEDGLHRTGRGEGKGVQSEDIP